MTQKMRMETIRKFRILNFGFWSRSDKKSLKPEAGKSKSESGMSMIAILAAMTIFALALLAVAPTIQIEVQREKELETIRRGEEVAFAIREYIEYHKGAKLPTTIDELLEGLPQGTKKRMILRPTAAVDPLSEDGKWRLIRPESKAFINFGRRVQVYNNGQLPSSGNQLLDRYAIPLANIVNTEAASDVRNASDEEIELVTDKAPFIGVASQSRSESVIAYYGIENHSKWLFTPLFRGVGNSGLNPAKLGELQQQNQPTNSNTVRTNTNTNRP